MLSCITHQLYSEVCYVSEIQQSILADPKFGAPELKIEVPELKFGVLELKFGVPDPQFRFPEPT